MSWIKNGVLGFFEYNSVKIIHIKSKSIGVINRVIQLAIIGYILGYVFLYKKEYQLEDTGIPGTTSKVKGVAYTDYHSPRIGKQLWDAEDIVIPSQENDAFFVTTNMIVTNEQRQGECPETTLEARCKNDSDCLPIYKPFLLGHGVSTGVCNATTGTCMVKAWCPIEIDEVVVKDVALLNGTKDFTVLIKHHVFFPYYGITRSNIVEKLNKKYLQGCTYDVQSNPLCPVFKLGYIVDEALKKHGTSTYDGLAVEGLNDNLTAKGYNFRYTNNYFDANHSQVRQLIKAYGFLFIITVDAKAAKFHVVPTLQNIGSGLGLLGIASVLCDIFVFHIHKRRKYYKEKKYEEVIAADSYDNLVHNHDCEILH